jgi:ribosomal protein S7
MKSTRKLKEKIINTLMLCGQKKTGEKILIKTIKRLQKSTVKKSKSLLHVSVINATPTFKFNEQIMKRGKRKAVKSIPYFITNDTKRIVLALKTIKLTSSKNKDSISFISKFTKEILETSSLKSLSIEHKNDLQKQVLSTKRYLHKFRW